MAELNISERQVGDVTVLDMDGKITIGEGSVALRTAIRRLLEEGKKKILEGEDIHHDPVTVDRATGDQAGNKGAQCRT